MIVLSFLLVIVAAVALVVGLVQDSLTWIWGSIASCVLALVLLGIGVLQRRGAPAKSASGQAGRGDEHDEASTAGEARASATAVAVEDVAVVPERTAGDAREGIIGSVGDVGEAARAATVVEDDRWAPDTVVNEPEESGAGEAAAVPTKRTGAGTTEEAAASARRPGEAADTERDGGTTGPQAVERLSEIRGLGTRKAQALIGAFGSLEAIRSASIDELVAVPGIGRSTAQHLKDEL